MLGYLHPGENHRITPPSTARGAGWYDTGDFVGVDHDGFVWIRGRAKRFAKIGGEMVSLAAVEELARRTWPSAQHAVVSVTDPRTGEQLVLLTNQPGATHRALVQRATLEGVSTLQVPKRILSVQAMPLLANGKVDYPAAQALAERELAHQWQAAN